ncbi:hypothetical protein OQX61_07455 [Pedobacter sp. PLR]|uniref:hypothetical protein n=1 Tax=Pedobacter sp. PLR TaxID=2994465 RepID=UPI0022484E59|nr:hypothetical protein [Pedobacter sp. PLR]MCX2451105.1 hypothetical protein [Pedobacter sp. PLR]
MIEFNETQTGLKTGEEHLVHNGEKLDQNLLGFWRWNSSDLLSNTTRGRFAEFIVASATIVDLNQVRDEWGAYDLITPEGIKIEVKSSAYVQSWEQKKLSKISFGIKAAFSWDEETKKRTEIAMRSADVYVFCLLHHENKETCDPLNLNHWEFYVLATGELNSYTRSQHSITINSLRKLTEPVDYSLLNDEVVKKSELNSRLCSVGG